MGDHAHLARRLRLTARQLWLPGTLPVYPALCTASSLYLPGVPCPVYSRSVVYIEVLVMRDIAPQEDYPRESLVRETE